MDLDAAVWTVPAERTKSHREHRVPLCRRAIEILSQAQELGDGQQLAFPSMRRKALSNMTLSKLMKELRHPGSASRLQKSSFRDWAAEQTGRAA